MAEQIINNVIDILVAAIVGGLIVWVKAQVKRRTDEDKAIIIAVKSLSHDALFRCATDILDRGTISQSELDNLNHLYEGYSALGMNGTGEQLYKQAKSKQITH